MRQWRNREETTLIYRRNWKISTWKWLLMQPLGEKWLTFVKIIWHSESQSQTQTIYFDYFPQPNQYSSNKNISMDMTAPSSVTSLTATVLSLSVSLSLSLSTCQNHPKISPGTRWSRNWRQFFGHRYTNNVKYQEYDHMYSVIYAFVAATDNSKC